MADTQGRVLFLIICAAGIGGTFQFGYNLSIINAPTLHIQEFTNETWQARTGEPLPDHMVLLVWSLIVSLFPLGGLLGALLAGPMAIKLGRKKSLLVNNIFVVTAAMLFGFSHKAGSFEMIMLGRLLMGVSAGVSMNIQPMYLGESAPKELRGAVAMTSAIFTALGIVMGQVVGLSPAAAAGHPGCDKGDEGDGGGACCLPGPPGKAPMGVVPGSGPEEVYAYASSVFWEAGVPEEMIQYAIIGTGSCELFATFVSCVVIERVGRKVLLMGGYSLMTFWATIFTVALCLKSSFPWMPYLAMSCIFAFILSFGIGPAGVTGILATELFDQTARPAAYMVCGALMWTMLFLVGIGLPFIMPSTLDCSSLRPKARPSWRSLRNCTDSTCPCRSRAPQGVAGRSSSPQSYSCTVVAGAKGDCCPVLCFSDSLAF
ncbi:solute carrier family 2, facilitated glucose transporter member 11 isoform X6 [Sciurus carolinensis]|uniref:solute carrier family 2, facilitated glucose transporter member 11 isoform X6 n=1 Tax=Sciurus carolinensis TaxID=30640 RepID=UPI001FB3D742|nr:solute carrier family 2, facilitated glucose transporter member 11 isoform X6 [Sciurus carolinensis]